ncbi:MAG: inner membrane CreD family protein [Actinomycetia bacterium]|nr:inner membrane CreD family protein [Actinomycetes bacterium]
MTVKRLIAIALIFVLAAGAWLVLAGTVDYRTNNSDEALGARVEGLWGGPQAQPAPTFSAVSAGRNGALDLLGSDITADFKLDQRRKGLLWYATYAVDFSGAYRVKNAASAPATATFALQFPSAEGQYDGFVVDVDGKPVAVTYGNGSATGTFRLPAGATALVETSYRTQGLDSWTYVPVSQGVGAVKDFTLIMTTDFTKVDFPDGAVSPTSRGSQGGGTTMTWRYENLVSGRPITLTMPKPMNPGPLAARISMFAPISLLFFFAALVLLTATRGIRLHPMNYGFLAAGFFAFHLLFAYLVDRVDINVSFLIASVASVALCVGYLWMVLGAGKALVEIAVSQFVFLVLFSYSFFFEGLTGLAVTIGSVVTLGYFMAKTAHVDWESVFGKPKSAAISEPLSSGPA